LTINVPNILTIARILCTPLFVILLLKNQHLFALGVFTLAGITDGLDGLWARGFNQRTQLGAYLDPIADKLLLMASYISLAVLGLLPSWLSVIVITRDVLIVLGIAVFTITAIPVEIKPSLVSKLTTVIQLATVFWTLLDAPGAAAHIVGQTLFWATAGLTIVSGLHYIYVGMRTLEADTAK
jgi:cardiolipin synthase